MNEGSGPEGEAERPQPFQVIRGGVDPDERQRAKRRWNRPARRAEAKSSARRPLRWTRCPATVGPSRHPRGRCEKSGRKPRRRRARAPLRRLQREKAMIIWATASREEYVQLLAGQWQVFKDFLGSLGHASFRPSQELRSSWGFCEGIDPNG
jgi:hypothetical protein